MSELNNVNPLDNDALNFIRKKMEEEEKQKTRQARLKAMLNDSENKDVNKVLYEQGGLKEIIEKDPEILDTESSIRLALQTAGHNYKNLVTQQEAQKKQEEEERQKQLNATTKPLSPQSQAPSGNPQQEQNPQRWTDLTREQIKEIFLQDPKYASRAEELSWTAEGAKTHVSRTFYNN